jgi:hypothetical protein
MQRHHSSFDTLEDVSCGDVGHLIHPFGHEEHLRHRSDDANPSTPDSRQGLNIPANRDRSRTCAACGTRFPKSELLALHARSTKHKCYRCMRDPSCTKVYAGRTGLSRHEAGHSALRKHTCSKCNARFKRRDHYKEHEDACRATPPSALTRHEPTQASDLEPEASV